jgi:2-dehydropantoate 2-reductase
MRILVVGAGSTGGYFRGRLAQAGRDVTFLLRPGRAQRIRADELQIVSPLGDVTLAPKLVTAGEFDSPYDAVLLTVKAFSLDAALDDLTSAVGPETVILPVLNGMKHMDLFTARFGRNAVAGCVCKIAAMVDAQGRIVQLNTLQDLVYGECDGFASDRMIRLDAVMQGAGFNARLSPTVEREMWEKWILLATLGGVTCLMRGTVGEIEAAPDGAAFALRFLDEVTAIVTAAGTQPSEAFLAGARAAVTQKGSPLTSSMYRDLQNGSPVEAEQIIGDLLTRGQKAHIDAPLSAAAFSNLSIYQNRVAAA